MKCLQVIIGIVCALCLNCAWAATTVTYKTATANGYTWTYVVESSSASLVYNASTKKPCIIQTVSGTLTIPDKLGGYSVTKINTGAFTNCTKLTRVIVPASVKNIYGGFVGCAALTNVTIASTALNMNGSAFQGCTALVSFTSTSAKFATEDGVLYNADKTELVRVPTALTTVALASTVTNLKSYALSCSAITALHLPASVSYFAYNAFEKATQLMAFTVDANSEDYVAHDGLLYDKSDKILMKCPPALGDLKIHFGVTNIAEHAFNGNVTSAKIKCPRTLVDCSQKAFTSAAIGEISFDGDVPYTLASVGNCGIALTVKIRYNRAYEANWLAAIQLRGFKSYAAYDCIGPGMVFIFN